MNLRNVGDSKFTVHHTILVEMCLHLKPTGFSQWVVHNYDVDDDIVIEIRSRKDGERE